LERNAPERDSDRGGTGDLKTGFDGDIDIIV